MRTRVLAVLAVALLSTCVFGVDGVVLINQSTVMAAGGFPYVISQSGSYKLSGNLIVIAANTDGIHIAASNVTLDLNGFTVSGPPQTCPSPPCPLTTSGISVPVLASNVTVRNGTVIGFAAQMSLSATSGLAEDLTLQASSGGNVNGTNGVGASFVVHHVVSSSSTAFAVTCPSIVSESIANSFFTEWVAPTTCLFVNVIGPIT